MGSVIVKRMQPRNLVATAGWQLIIGSLPLLALSAVVERDLPVHWTGAFVSLLLVLALLGSAVATALWYWLVQREEVGRLTLFLFLTPVLGLGIAAAVFGERIGPVETIGIALTLTGIRATMWDDLRRTSVGSDPARPDQIDASEPA